jgi:hypothetical protein
VKKYAHLLLAFSLAGSIAAACSAVGNPTGTSSGTGAGGAVPASSSASSGTAGSPSSSGTGGSTTTSSSSGAASSSGSGGSTTTSSSSGASSSSGTASSSSSSGLIDFDGGWQIPDSGMMPPLMGDGGTTVEIGPGADSGSPGKFGGPTSGTISVVYPPNGVITPPNTNSIEFHFIPSPGETLFELTFHAPSTTLKVYTGCTPLNGGCVYTPDAVFWQSLVAYARGTAPVTYTVRGVNGNSPGSVGTSAQRTIAFAEQDISGGIYYWNTAGVIQRYDFGFPNAPAQLYLTPASVGAFACVGCHVMSRDGARIAVGQDIPSPAPYKVLDVLSKQQVMSSNGPVGGQANFFSFSPDAKYLLTSDGVSISMLDVGTNTALAPAFAYPATMPDWSPDGLHMVYAKPQSPPPFNFPVPGVDSASLMTMHFNGAGWDNPTTLVPFNGQNNYYPAYSPDGQWVVFNRSPSNAESFANAAPDPDAGTMPDGELWAVSANGGSAVRLSQATDPGACSWPKWAPVKNDYYGGKIMWLTFSSARAYGLRLSQGQRTQLWMVAFDPAKAMLGQDATFPAFWLPFQDISGGNHIAQWTTKIPRKPCNTNSDCDQGEFCKNGHCQPG